MNIRLRLKSQMPTEASDVSERSEQGPSVMESVWNEANCGKLEFIYPI